jgi:hypothetical protein
MASEDKRSLLNRLDAARAQLEMLVPRVDPGKEIYPNWTLRQMLAHITGWDDATIDSLRTHVTGRKAATPAELGIDAYNVTTVASRHDLDLDHVLKEWRLTRQILRTIVEDMPEDKFLEPLIFPWGDRGTVTELIEIFIGHEEEHRRDIGRWLEHPEKPLLKKGN